MRWALPALAALIVCGTLGLVLTAMVMIAPGARPGGRYMVQVEPGQTLIYAVPPETLEVVLVSSSLADPGVPVDARQAGDVALDIAWVAPSGEVRREERIWERTRVTAWPVRGGSWRPSALARDGGDWATDTRNTILPVVDNLPAGGELRITAPLDGPSLLFRAYGGRVEDVQTNDRKGEERRRIARRVGVSTIDVLEGGERRLAMGRPRRSLAYRLQSGESPVLRRLIRAQPPLHMTEQPVAGSTLLPGQAAALHLHGPVRVRISVPDGLADLLIESVVDLPEGLEPPALQPEPAPPLPLAGGREGTRVLVVNPDTTLRVTNRSRRTIGPVVFAVETESAEVLAAETPGIAIERLAPWSDEALTLTGPDRVTLPTLEVGPDHAHPVVYALPLGAPPVRVTVRPIFERIGDARGRTPVRVSFYDADQTLLDAMDLAVPVQPAPLERRASDGGWVGEAVPFVLESPVGTATLEVESPEMPSRISAHVEGPPRGRPDTLKYPGRSLRYRRQALLPWHWLAPANVDALREAHQVRPVLANVRLEALREDPNVVERRYALLDPLPEAEGLERTWLIPGPYADGLAWCRLDAGVSKPAPWGSAAVAARNGELHAILHTPGRAALGAPWRLYGDGRILASGRINQRMESVRLVGLSPLARVRLEAPAGSQLWLRSVDGPFCVQPHRGVSAWPTTLDEPIDFVIDATQPGHRLYLAGFAEEPVTYEITLTGLAPTAEDAQAGVWTERVRLMPGESLAQRLRDPDVRQPPLSSVGFQLGSNVDEVGLRVVQVQGPPAWLRILTEIDEIDRRRSGPATLLRRTQ